MNAEERLKVAVQLAPRFEGKFDFSTPNQFELWADMAFQAADAFIKKAALPEKKDGAK